MPAPTDRLDTSERLESAPLPNGLPRPELPPNGLERVSALWKAASDRLRERTTSYPRLGDSPVAMVVVAATLAAGLVVVAPHIGGWFTGTEHNLVDNALPALNRSDLIDPAAEQDTAVAGADASNDNVLLGPTDMQPENTPDTPAQRVLAAGDQPGNNATVESATVESANASQPEDLPPEPVVVHVAGAIDAPGVVELSGGARVVDAITSAGGPADDADLDRLNLAEPLRDGQRIFVPAVGDTEAPQLVELTAPRLAPTGTETRELSGAFDAAPAPLVAINSAGRTELETLPGIGPAMASAIVAFREENGRFLSVEQLLDVSGIGPARLETLRPLVTVS